MASKYLDHQGIAIAEGMVKDVSCVNKFGSTSGTITTESTIWDAEDATAIYPYPAAGVAAVTDNSTDTGAVVVVEGLDANYNLTSTSIPVGSPSPVVFSRVFRAYMESAINADDVDITIGGALAARIIAGAGQTQMAVYTIPSGFTGYLIKIHGSSDRNQGTTATQFRLRAREFHDGGVFRIKGTYGTAGGDQFDYEYPVPLRFPAKTDIRIDATATQLTIVSAIFDIVLVATGR